MQISDKLTQRQRRMSSQVRDRGGGDAHVRRSPPGKEIIGVKK